MVTKDKKPLSASNEPPARPSLDEVFGDTNWRMCEGMIQVYCKSTMAVKESVRPMRIMLLKESSIS